MSIQIKTHIEDDILFFTVTGSTETVKDLVEYGNGIGEATLDSDVKRVLMDERTLALNEDDDDVSEFSDSDSIASLTAMGIRLACLSSEDNLEMNRSYEEHLQQRNLNFKVFTEKKDAVKWLLYS